MMTVKTKNVHTNKNMSTRNEQLVQKQTLKSNYLEYQFPGEK